MAIEKLESDANLKQLITAFENGVVEIENVKKDIIEALILKGAKVTQQSLLSELSEKIRSIKTVKEYFGEADEILISKEEPCIYLVYNNKKIEAVAKDNVLKTFPLTITENGNAVLGMVIDENENLYVSPNYNCLRKYNSSGNLIFEKTGVKYAYTYLKYDKKDKGIIIKNQVNDDSSIRKLNSNGEEIWKLNIKGSQPIQCIATDDLGYISSGGHDKIVQRISPDGRLIWEYTGFTNFITSIYIDSKQNTIIAGYGYRSTPPMGVVKISPQGMMLWHYQGYFKSPIYSIVTDSQDYVCVGCWDGSITKLTPDGELVWKIKINTTPCVLRVDSKDDIYVGVNDSIYKILSDGSKIIKYIVENIDLGSFNSLEIDREHGDKFYFYNEKPNDYKISKNAQPTDFSESAVLTYSIIGDEKYDFE